MPHRTVLCGGAGFLGHHLALALQQTTDFQPFIVDALSVNNLVQWAGKTGLRSDRSWQFLLDRMTLLRQAGIPLLTCDARDYTRLSRVLAEIRPQVIIHLAAVAHAGTSNKTPFDTFDHSLRTLENALDYARGKNSGVQHFIYQSSSMVYGHMPKPATEEDILDPVGVYGNLKLAAERMVLAYWQTSGVPCTITRPSALYGPRCVSRRVIQVFIETALVGWPLEIDGDGEEILDFTHVDDWVQGMLLVLRKRQARNQVFNLTYGQGRSLNELAACVQSHFPAIEVRHVARDNLMPFRNTLSIAKARCLLGYAPQVPLEEGVAKYVQWYKSLSNT